MSDANRKDEAETIGADLIPRIPFDDFAHDLKESLRPKVERLGYCGEIWQIGANAPQSTFHFPGFRYGRCLPARLEGSVGWRCGAGCLSSGGETAC